MTEFLRSSLELTVLLPGMLLACLPVKGYLRMSPARLAAVTVPLILFLCCAGGAVSCLFLPPLSWEPFMCIWSGLPAGSPSVYT